MSEQENVPPIVEDEGAISLAFVLQLMGLPADAHQILHQSGKAALNDLDLVRAARQFPVKVRLAPVSASQLATTPMPALALMRDGGWWVLGQVGPDKLLVKDPTASAPEGIDRERFLEQWSGKLLLITRRAPLGDPHRRFDVSWFMAAIHKYRTPLSEVFVASFFLQIFALLAPLFFQVIIDKVFVHRGLSTLEVLAFGLAVMSVFEVVLGGVRTYLFSHTSNRVDVELGARVFRHLFALPLSYFQTRRIGDTVARVRELDTIRQFLTSSAITLTLDLFFAVIFLVVLFVYSPLLATVAAAALPLYVLVSMGVTPLFRTRLNQQFRRGADNQAIVATLHNSLADALSCTRIAVAGQTGAGQTHFAGITGVARFVPASVLDAGLDDVAVAGYEIFVNGVSQGTAAANATSFNVTTLPAGEQSLFHCIKLN